MQFDHPHAFRGEVCDALIDKVPDVFDAALAAGAEIGTVAELTGVKVSLQCRGVTFERELGRIGLRPPDGRRSLAAASH